MDQTESPALTTKEAPAWPPLSLTALAIPVQPSPSCLQACAGPAPTPETPSCSPSTALLPGPAQVCPLRPDSSAGPAVRAPQASQALSQESQASPKQRDVQIETWFLALSRAFENRKGFRATGRRASENALPVPAGSRQAAASQTPLPALPGDPSCALAGPPPRCPGRPQRGGGRLPPPAPGGRPDTGPLRPQCRLPTQPSGSVWRYRPQHSTSQEFHAVRASPTRRSLVTFPSM